MVRKLNSQGRGAGRGGAGRGGSGRGRTYTKNNSKPIIKKMELCKELESHVFDFGTKTATNQMRITQEKIVQYVRA